MRLKAASEQRVKAYGGVDLQLHSFLALTLDGGEWSVSGSGRFNSRGKRAPGHPQDKNVSASQSQYGHFDDDINLLPLHGFEPRFLGGAARRVVTVLSELHRSFLLDYKRGKLSVKYPQFVCNKFLFHFA